MPFTFTKLQQNLLDAGCDPNGIDGKWGKDTLAALMAYISASRITPLIRAIAAELAVQLPASAIDKPLRIVHFLAQQAHESAGFARLTESFAYRPETLLATFPARVKTLENAAFLIKSGPAVIAEAVYGQRTDLGNTHTGDGARYIGRGLSMITGRANYSDIGKRLGLDFVNRPELVAEPHNAVLAAITFWMDHGLNGFADSDVGTDAALIRITKIINGGQNGFPDRKLKLQRGKNVWGL